MPRNAKEYGGIESPTPKSTSQKRDSLYTISTMPMSDSMSPTDSATVPTDLTCLSCGYNLRTLAWDGLCPECGRPVRDSVLPANLCFASYRGIRRTRLGLAIWIVSLAVPAIGTIIFTTAILSAPWFWDELGQKGSLARTLFLAANYAWSYSSSVACLLQAVAIILVTAPLAPGRERFKPRLAFAAAGLALLSGCGVAFSFLASWFGLVLPNPQAVALLIGPIADAGFALSLLLAWVYLRARLDPRRCRLLRLTMQLCLVAPVLVLVGNGLHIVVTLTDLWMWATPGQFADELRWWSGLRDISMTWAKYGGASCRILMLLVLWAYVRVLNASLRRRG